MAASSIRIRRGAMEDLDQLTEIYNHYVVNTAFTFDFTPFRTEDRQAWMQQFLQPKLPFHVLIVAEREGAEDGTGKYERERRAVIVGFAYASTFRAKPAYNRSVESTVYVRDGEGGNGVGSALYRALLEDFLLRGASSNPYYDAAAPAHIQPRKDGKEEPNGEKQLREEEERLLFDTPHRCYAVIVLPNDASVKLHKNFGFREVGVMTEVGYKFGQWWSTMLMEKKDFGGQKQQLDVEK